MTKQKKHKSGFWRVVMKVISFLILFVALAVAGILGYVNFKKNEIGKNLIREVNILLVGEINVEKIEIQSLWTYPDINVSLRNVKIYEADAQVRESSATPVIKVPELLVRINFKELFSNKLELEFVEITDAVVVIERTKDAEVTIGNTFIPAEKDTSNADSNVFVLEINSIRLVNTQIFLVEGSLNDTLPIRLKELTGDLTFANSEVSGFAEADGYFEKLDISDDISFTDSPLSFEANYSVAIDEQKVYVTSPKIELIETPFQFDFVFDYASTSNFKLDFKTSTQGLQIGSAFNSYDSRMDSSLVYLKGLVHLFTRMNWTSNPKKSFLNNLNADIDIYGSDIHIMGVDIEAYIDKYKRSQNFTLVDVGAVMFAGPAGLAITKGSDYTVLMIKSKGDDSTVVHQFVSEWRMKDSRVAIRDLAMSTERSRIASLGYYDLDKDSIAFSILVLDKSGCALANQSVYGYTNDVQSGKVKIVKTLLGPVNNFFKQVGLANCEVLYDGKVTHPEKEKELF